MDEDALERLLHDESAKPCVLPLSLLRAITNDFDPAREIGRGAFATVYEGVLRNGTVAVKKYREPYGHGLEQRFQNEVSSLRGLKDKNIVRLLGYCPQSEMMDYEGTMIMAERYERLLCFEYLRGGNLYRYITDASHGFGWEERYKTIKGICEGASYLHENLTIHLDLTPANIWLDEKTVPKVLYFGCSRRIEEKQSEVILEDLPVMPGYMAPEVSQNRGVTLKADIYSIGVLIMEILTGHKENLVVENVLKSWANRLGTSLQDMRLKQIRVCAEIATSCLEHDPEKRPDAEHIIKMLVKTESMDEFSKPDETTMELNILEHVVAGSKEPSHLDLSLLQSITGNFSEQRKIGVGGCAQVYKGILRNGIVAVKRLSNRQTIEDKMFHREVKSLIRVRHENIVRFLGYCSFTEERIFIFEGRTIMADIRERLLCFEYIRNGNLENYITDELRGLEWHTRYEIIVGICKGLLYLHEDKDIVHMDLKPANILLDNLMVPKITDFGLSRLDNNSHTATTSRFISPGYCAPEYFLEGKSSSKSDIYSLGVIVTELVTGSKKDPDLTKVLRRWRHRWIKSKKHTPLGYQQLTKCLELAQRCIQINPTARPDIVYIMDELNTIDSKGGQFQEIPCLDDMLGIEPLEIHFPFKLDPQTSHSIELTNDTDNYIAFMMNATLGCFRIEPDKGIVPPQCKCSVTIKMQAQVKEHELPNNHKEKITVESSVVDGGLLAMDITGDMFIEKEGTMVDEVNVMVVFDKPPLADEES